MKEINFPNVTNILTIEIINTEIISHGKKKDLLNEKEDLLKFLNYLKQKEIIHPENCLQGEGYTDKDLENLKEFRTFLRNMFDSYIDSGVIEEEWINFLECKIMTAPITYKFIESKLVEVPIGKVIDSLISLIALDTLNIIAKDEMKYVRRCSNPVCILLFFDKTGRKKWCSMKICGNRNKVNRYNERHKNT